MVITITLPDDRLVRVDTKALTAITCAESGEDWVECPAVDVDVRDK